MVSETERQTGIFEVTPTVQVKALHTDYHLLACFFILFSS